MNKREAILFLFQIAREIENTFKSPVILFTFKDYADGIFKSLVDMREALLENAAPKKVAGIVNSFHFQWLEAVQDVEMFKKRIKETPRDAIIKAIDYTMKCTVNRYKYLRNYIEKLKNTMTEDENLIMQADLHIIEEMQDIVNSTLLDKKKAIRSQADQTEYHAKVNDEIEELMNWLDKLNDSLAIQFCKVLNLKVPLSPSDLTKTLKQIIDEVAADPTPEAQMAAELINIRGKMLGSVVRISTVNELEISKVVEKIKLLEDRISRLEGQSSSALMALKHKMVYLEEQLQSLEDIKMTRRLLQEENADDDSEAFLQRYKETHIFNHLLPHNDRCRLVEKLVQLWHGAIVEHDHESIISILSVADLKEMFTDDKGTFHVDVYGRKVYSKADDENLYQLNERDELVPINDDEKHIFYYDSCGRYYINEARERIYKDHDGASEYMLSKGGNLIKIQEEINGVKYYYDWLGRYRINSKGKHIYCDDNNSFVEHEHDGLGNLVKIHTQHFYYAHVDQPMTMEENRYLKQVVGAALKKCIAHVILLQPSDPVLCLAECLEKYRKNIAAHQKYLQIENERFEERELVTVKENSPNRSSTDDESTRDYNFIQYEPEEDGDH